MPAKWKIRKVGDLKKKLSDSKVIGVASIKSLPSRQFQEIRKKLKDKLDIQVVKNRLAYLAIDDVEKNKRQMKMLEEVIDGPTALVFSEESPFKIARQLRENRSNAPAKPGEIAPYDIVIPAGDTPFKPGPVIGELQGVGIKAKIQDGIIKVVEDSPVVKKGEPISKELAGVLAKLEVEPMEIGVALRAAYEDGVIYDSETLNIDDKETLANVQTAYSSAFNLAMNAGIMNGTTIKPLIQNAAAEAKNLAIEADIVNKDTIEYFLSKASSEASALSSKIPDAPEPKAEEKKEEPKTEEPEPEVKEEEKKEEPAEEVLPDQED